MTSKEIEIVISQLFEGSANEGDAQELQEILKSDASARAIYLDHARLHRTLECRFGRSSPVREASRFSSHYNQLQQKKIIKVSVLAALVAVLVMALILSGLLVPTLLPTATLKAAPQSIFSIENPPNTELKSDELVDGSRVLLSEGTLELTTANGSRTIIQGPADFIVIDKSQIRLNRGVAWFHIAEKDQGYRIITSTLDVVDLGTDFGIIASDSMTDEVHVFSGTVEAEAINGTEAKQILKKGEARQADSHGQLSAKKAEPELFLRDLPDGLPFLRFSFDQMQGNQISVDGNHAAVAHIKARLADTAAKTGLVPGIEGKALNLTGSGDHVITDWPGITGKAPRSVTCWIKVDENANLTRAPGIVGWGNPKSSNGKWKVLLIQETLGGPAYPRLSIGFHAYDAHIPANDGKWHHLAVTFDGTSDENDHPNIAIYVDGIQQPLSYVEGWRGSSRLLDTQASPYPLAIGTPIEAEVQGSFAGMIDELTIYAGTLSPEIIRAQAMQTPPRLPSI